MQPRLEEVTPIEKQISDALTHRPSIGQSAWDNFAQGVTTAPHAIASLDEQYRRSPEGRTAHAVQESVERGNQNPEVGGTQWGVNQVANMIGQGLNPLTWIAGEVGSLAVKPAISAVSRIAPETISAIFKKPISQLMAESAAKYIPEYIGKEGEEKTLSMALVGRKWAEGFGVGAGAALPQEVLDNLNYETGKLDYAGMAKGLGAAGIFGMAINTIPFAWGVAKANFNRIRGLDSQAAVEGSVAEKAYAEGRMSKEEYELFRDFEDYSANPDKRPEMEAELKKRATDYLAAKGHPVDQANHTAQFEILNREQLQNLQSATVDQLVSDYIPEEHRTALSDFTVQAGLDEMRNKPEVLDGVRGYVKYADQNLAKQDEILAHADRVVDEHFKESNFHPDMPFSQADIYKIAKEKQAGQLPFAIPQEVSERVKAQQKVDGLQSKSDKLFSEYEKTGNSKVMSQIQKIGKEIEDLKESLPPLKTASEELVSIRDDLLPDKKLRPDYKDTKSFHRLSDLADVWEPAKTLLDRVNLEAEIRQQEAYRDLAKQMLGIADANIAKMADVDKVKNYFKARNNPPVDEIHQPSMTEEEVVKQYKSPADAVEIIAEQDRIVEEKGGEMDKQEYDQAKEKFQEFQKSEGIFNNFIKCLLGSQT